MSNAGDAGGRALGAVWRVWQGRMSVAKTLRGWLRIDRSCESEGNPVKAVRGGRDVTLSRCPSTGNKCKTIPHSVSELPAESLQGVDNLLVFYNLALNRTEES